MSAENEQRKLDGRVPSQIVNRALLGAGSVALCASRVFRVLSQALSRPQTLNQSTMMTHIGKIARLPESIRNQLNQRLADGQPAKKILPWLNSHPKVKPLIKSQILPLRIPPNCTQLQPIQEIVKRNSQTKASGPWFPLLLFPRGEIAYCRRRIRSNLCIPGTIDAPQPPANAE